jgi:hypothetical protein
MLTYTIGVLFFLAVWLGMYTFTPKSRKVILWSSIAWGHAGPISEYWHLKDYWNPTYIYRFEIGSWTFGVEDYIFAFAYGGLAAGIFDIISRKAGQRELAEFNPIGFIKLLLAVILCLFLMSVLVAVFNINSLNATIVVLLIGSLILVKLQPKWILPVIITAIIAGNLMWIFYWGFYIRLFPGIIEQWWYPEAFSGISLGGVPIEEVIWATATALFVGPLLRYCMGKNQQAPL